MDEPVLLAGRTGTLLSALAQHFANDGIACRISSDAGATRTALSHSKVSVLVQCGRLDDGPANDVLRWVRSDAANASIPVIVIGEEGDVIERIVALELGADDYLAPPVIGRELVLRVRALLRRQRPRAIKPAAHVRIGRIELDRDERRVWVDGSSCPLSGSEFRLLVALASPVGVVHSRERLRQSIEPAAESPGHRWINRRIARLRDRLGAAGVQVETVRGIGYRLFAYDTGLSAADME